MRIGENSHACKLFAAVVAPANCEVHEKSLSWSEPINFSHGLSFEHELESLIRDCESSQISYIFTKRQFAIEMKSGNRLECGCLENQTVRLLFEARSVFSGPPIFEIA